MGLGQVGADYVELAADRFDEHLALVDLRSESLHHARENIGKAPYNDDFSFGGAPDGFPVEHRHDERRWFRKELKELFDRSG